ncbi:MAG: C-terminal binding protein [Geminicoccaceae bacterium]
MSTDRAKILRTDANLETPRIDEALCERGELVLLPDGVSEEVVIDAISDADLLLTCYTPITARVIERAKRLKGIVKYGVGIDSIDIEAAKARAIPVVNVPDYAAETVAEGAFALMIALAKKLRPLQKAMDAEGWVWPSEQWLGSDISGKTLGLVGFGQIGRSMARMAGLGFNARVLAYSPHTSAEAMRLAGVEKRDDLHGMLGESNFVSVHAVLNPETRHLIDKAALAAMKPGAILINTARGAIVDEKALVQALQAGRIGGAGLDVFSQEPLATSGHMLSPLFEMDNVILTPHLTFYTQEAMQRLEDESLERSVEILEGRPVLIKSSDPRLTAQTKGVVFPKSD